MTVSTQHIDYLERRFATEDPTPELAHADWAFPTPETVDLVRLQARARVEDDDLADAQSAAEMTDVLVGLHASSTSFLFVAVGDREGLSVHSGGCCHPGPESSSSMTTPVAGRSLIQGVCPGLQAETLDTDSCARLSARLEGLHHVALAVGTPTLKPLRERMVGSQMDRFRRALDGCEWGYVVTALPVREPEITRFGTRILNEIRVVCEANRVAGGASPIGEKYLQCLEALWTKTQNGKNQGLWHSAVFLMANDAATLQRIKAVARAVFGGESSVPDPFVVLDAGAVSKQASAFGAVLTEAPAAPGSVAYPYRHLSLLSSPELATLAQCPQLETPGFHVLRHAEFDVNPHHEQQDPCGICIGDVVNRGRPAGPRFVVEQDSLCRHVLVTGTTGSGKTNTLFHLLGELAHRNVPFLVIEPVKSEYRRWTGPETDQLPLVFTAGREGCAPLRLNPFEVQPGTSVSEHLDLLRAAFAASFGLWTPLPQVLEQSLHAVYADKGWDLARNSNRRGGADGTTPARAFPTLTDLVRKVGVVTERLGYGQETTDEIRSALMTRLNALRVGGKGRLLDVERSLPAETLFGRSTVIELEGLGADEDKAFVMALLMVQLAAYRRRLGPSRSLTHVLVIEEAHRLLTNVSQQREERAADPRGKAVETFVNLLAEVRAYGQGVIAVDQVPVKLAPDLIKNTNLKIAHRVVAETDRRALGGAMVMDEDQMTALATLSVGEAAVFGAGDDEALLVRVPLAVNHGDEGSSSDRAVGDRMDRVLVELGGWASRFAPCSPGCSGNPEACEGAADVVHDRKLQSAFARLVLSVLDHGSALERLWPDVLQPIRALRPRHVPETDLLRCVVGRACRWIIDRRGAQAGWSFEHAGRFEDTLRELVLEHIAGDSDAVSRNLRALDELAADLHARDVDPFPRCGRVCTKDPATCLYRDAVSDLIDDGRFDEPWRRADAEDRGQGESRQASWQTAMDAALELIEFPESDWQEELSNEVAAAARRAALCFGQQMLSRDAAKVPRTVRISMDRLIREARHG